MIEPHNVLILGAIGLLAFTGFAFVAAILVRRRIRRIQENVRQLLVEPTCRLAESWLNPRATPALHSRIKLARTVSAAEHAVKMAIAADAPVGDLPSLCRRLRLEASRMDYALRIGHRLSRSSAELRITIQQASELSDAAVRIQETALSSVSGAASISSTRLLEDVRIESLASSTSFEKLRGLSH